MKTSLVQAQREGEAGMDGDVGGVVVGGMWVTPCRI